MTTQQELSPKYIKLYNQIRDLVNDEEVYPKKTDFEIEELVRTTDWFPVPSFGMTKKDIKKSDMAHISIRVNEGKIIADLFFNGKKQVKRFLNILDSRFENEKKDFADSIKDLGEDYTILIQYVLKDILAPADWGLVVPEIKCKELTERDVENMLQTIKNTEEKRGMEQKKWENKKTATMSVSLAKVQTDETDNSKIKEIFTNLAILTRLAHRIKSSREINKQFKDRKRAEEKELPLRYNERDNLIKEISGDESFGISSGRTTREATEKKKERLKEVEQKIKDIEEGKSSEH